MTERVIFLDFDGVLNSLAHFEAIKGKRAGNEWDSLDPAAVMRLNRICIETGAKVVVSSSWRLGTPVERLRQILGGVGFAGEVIGKTRDYKVKRSRRMIVDIPAEQRGEQIKDWLDERERFTGERPIFVVLDDDGDMDAVRDRFIQTSFHGGGLLDEHVSRAIAMLCEAP